MIKIMSILFISLVYSMTGMAQQPKLVPHPITLKNGKQFSLNLPAEYEIVPAAEGLKRVRFFAQAPDGRMFVTDMFDLSDNKKGTVYILDDWNAETGKFGKIIPYLTGLRNPNSVQFYTDAQGQDWLYVAETHQLTRQKYSKGETKPSNKADVLATFPDYGLSYKYGGWHLTRTIAIAGNRKIYVSVGSSCNACAEKEKVRASVIEMNPDGSDQKIYASGLRNAVGLKWIGKFLFATNQGVDHLGKAKPDETFYALKSNTDYGWPSCYSVKGKVMTDPKFKGLSDCKKAPAPYAYFPSHSSALGFDYFDDPNSNDIIKNSFLVALHGSTDEAIGHGYKIAIMRKGQKLETFMDGFLVGKTVHGRPADIYKIDEKSFYFSDDRVGVVYYVREKE
ncbi:glucose/sorbosone dehydrogenase [Acinetobacter sp. ANC 5054]|uniref:PQQ-dependent sugar dehydrogenase n=1 Tax=Acinetobacter sp. ANC 5054 TaxID=1977877 RepID=UPI000A353DCD|nr:glucose/sorbosone dehydrogenase [Acinetobacter sp. ANC 5054]OTG78995.1 glucose/sorbosone dehydrogenase [Acinetobacter sp. ANC 5054]